jgi:hypothetical protein
LVVSGDYVPSAGELTAHVHTAVDATVRWVDRALATPGHDSETWEQRNFYARLILMRGLERGELLGWVLQRDSLAAEGTDRATGLKQAVSYWSEARPDLHDAIAELRRAADIDPKLPAARDMVKVARDQLDMGRGWLADLADRLAETNRVVDVDRALTRERPEPTYGRDFL